MQVKEFILQYIAVLFGTTVLLFFFSCQMQIQSEAEAEIEEEIDEGPDPDLIGTLRYELNYYSFGQESSVQNIIPIETPSVDGQKILYSYSIKTSNTEDVLSLPRISINGEGKITINTITSYSAYATYLIQASAVGYKAQTVEINIRVEPISILAYNNEQGDLLEPVRLGQAIRDELMDDSESFLTIRNLSTIGEYTISFIIPSHTIPIGSFTRKASAYVIQLLKEDLDENNFSYQDGVEIHIKKDSTVAKAVAVYRPYEIRTWRDLQSLRINKTADYVLKNDIEFPTDIRQYEYEAIGTEEEVFSGSLDGNNYSIIGLHIDDIESSYQGLFGVVEAATKDSLVATSLTLKNFSIVGQSNVGSLIAWLKRGSIEKIHAEISSLDSGRVVSQRFSTGGIVGHAGTGWGELQVSIRNISSQLPVRLTGDANTQNFGGLVGQLQKNAELLDSHTSGNVQSKNGSFVGGLVGKNDGTILNSYATGYVIGRAGVGGLVGENSGRIEKSYATGYVIGKEDVGGLVGKNQGYIEAYATGNVSGDQSTGGLVGYNFIDAQEVIGFATGNVVCTEFCGGLVGSNVENDIIGFATGSVVAKISHAGSLLGANISRTASPYKIIGYGTGTVSSAAKAGGIYGAVRISFSSLDTDANLSIEAYSRSNITRLNGTNLDFGKIVANSEANVNAAYSVNTEDEGNIYDINETTILQNTTGLDGNIVNIGMLTNDNYRTIFNNLSFGSEIGEWTWIDSTKWPALNLGDFFPANIQPLD